MEIISDTVQLIPSYVPIPEANLDVYIRASLQELLLLLKNQHERIPGTKSDIIRHALIKLSRILQPQEPTPFTSPSPDNTPSTTIPPQPVPLQPTSEGGRLKVPLKIPPMSDTEFDKLLKSIVRKD